MKCRIICSWREIVFKNRIARLFQKTKILNVWRKKCLMDRVIYPRAYFGQALKRKAWSGLRRGI